MTRNILILLASAAAVPVFAQTAPQPPASDARIATEDDVADEDAIVIVGQRQRATVIGDIPVER